MTSSIDIIIENIISENLDYNPKRLPTRKLKYPCSICNKSVMYNQKALQCDTCDLWTHIKCDGTNDDAYKAFKEKNTLELPCMCNSRTSQTFPFHFV